MQESLVLFRSEFGEPRRVIAYGESAAGGVALNAAENYAGAIDGAVAMCATTAALTGYQIFDTFFMLKTLLAPDSDLPLDQIPLDAKAVAEAWNAVLTGAMETPEGRARIALVMTAAQHHVWATPDTPRPEPGNVEQFLAALADTVRGMPARLGTMHLWERIPPHSLFGNDGVDYTAYFNNGDPQYRQIVRQLYESAGLDLSTDLAALDGAPRITTNREGAIAFFDEPRRHEEGRPRVPLLRVHTVGDRSAPEAQVAIYTDLVNRNGLHALYRSVSVDRGGHCNFTAGEALAAIHVMMERLDTGDWPSVSPPAMNALAVFYEPGAEHAFVPTRLRPFNGEWRMFEFSSRFGPPLH